MLVLAGAAFAPWALPPPDHSCEPISPPRAFPPPFHPTHKCKDDPLPSPPTDPRPHAPLPTPRVQVPWPLSIAAPEAALAQYQMVFRHLFELKWVERELTRVVQLLQRTAGLANRRSRLRRAARASPPPGGGGDPLDAALAQAYGACQLMTHFFRQYLLYVTFEVMEPLWAAFQARVQAAASLDEVGEAGGLFSSLLSALVRLASPCAPGRELPFWEGDRARRVPRPPPASPFLQLDEACRSPGR